MHKKIKMIMAAMFAAAVVVGGTPMIDISNPVTVQAATTVKAKSIYFKTWTTSKPRYVYVGDVCSQAVTFNPTNVSSKTVTWKSSNTSIATVTSAGKVTAKKAGTVTITATTTDGSKKSASYKVVVKNRLITGLKFTSSSKSIYAGSTVTQSPTVTPSNATIKSFTWKSSNTSVATVNSNGKVTGKKAGTAKITATAKDGSKKSATYTVTVKAKASSTSKKVVTNINTIAPKADSMVKYAFNYLGFTTTYDPTVSYSGYFNAKNRSITLQEQDDTIYHELGHFVSFVAGNVDESSSFKSVYNAEKSKYTAYNKAYVTKDAHEYFAESYKNYVLNKSALKAQRPKTYAAIESAVKNITNARIEKVKSLCSVIWK